MKKITLLLFVLLIIILPIIGVAAITNSIASGNWSAAGTWDNGVPSNNKEAVIKAGHAITLDVNVANPGTSLLIEDGGSLTSTGTNGIYIKTNGSFKIYGTMNVYSIDIKNGVDPKYIYTSGDVTVSFLFDHSGTQTAPLTVDGTLSVNPGTLSNDGVIEGSGTVTATTFTGTGSVFGVSPTSSITGGSTVSGYTWAGDQGDSEWNTDLNWAAGLSPSASTHNVVIPSGLTFYPTISTSGEVCNDLLIESGATLTIGPGADLSVSGTLTSSADGGIIINSTLGGTGSLYHTSDNVHATIKRYITGNSDLTQNAYHLVSVPLNSSNSNLFTNLFLDSYLFKFNESAASGNEWYSYGTSTTTPLAVDQGYMIYYPGTSKTYSFAGKLNNGTFSCSVAYTGASYGYNLVPNPYSFDIDWDAASGWTRTAIGNTIWIYNPTEQNYGAYIKNGGPGSGTNSVTNKISVGQAFFVQATGTPTLTMTNAIKTSGASFLKETTELKDHLKVRVSAGDYSDEAIVQFRLDGTAQVDPMNDAAKLYGADYAPQLYTLAGDEKLSINTLPFSKEEVLVPLAIEYNSNETCSLSFEDIESFSSEISIELQDKVTGEVINLRQNPSYSFDYNTYDDPERFVIHFNGVTKVDDNQQLLANIYKSEDKLFINMLDADNNHALLEVFNNSGQKIMTSELGDQGKHIIDFRYPRGLYIVVLTMNSQVIKKKIIN